MFICSVSPASHDKYPILKSCDLLLRNPTSGTQASFSALSKNTTFKTQSPSTVCFRSACFLIALKVLNFPVHKQHFCENVKRRSMSLSAITESLISRRRFSCSKLEICQATFLVNHIGYKNKGRDHTALDIK